MTRAVLVLLALTFVGFGLAFAIAPVDMGALVELKAETSTARADVRAVYGGLELGLGAFLLWCARRREAVGTGLIAALCAFAALGLGRAIGIAVDGEVTGMTLRLLASEVVAAALAAFALWRESLGRESRAGVDCGRLLP